MQKAREPDRYCSIEVYMGNEGKTLLMTGHEYNQ